MQWRVASVAAINVFVFLTFDDGWCQIHGVFCRRRSRPYVLGCDLWSWYSRNNQSQQQEVALLSYLALPIRLADLLFNMCAIKGQDDRLQQETAVREKERKRERERVSQLSGHLFLKVHCHSGELQEEVAQKHATCSQTLKQCLCGHWTSNVTHITG